MHGNFWRRSVYAFGREFRQRWTILVVRKRPTDFITQDYGMIDKKDNLIETADINERQQFKRYIIRQETSSGRGSTGPGFLPVC